MNDNQDYIISLTDDLGNEVEFEFLDLINYELESYVVLAPADDEEAEVVILKVLDTDDEDEEETYVGVDDEEVLHAVYGIFKERFKDVFNFED
jgi:uncharacterized protein YrzB (UPF0473 family)